MGTLIDSIAYSTWNKRPSGEYVLTPWSYSVLHQHESSFTQDDENRKIPRKIHCTKQNDWKEKNEKFGGKYGNQWIRGMEHLDESR